MCQQISSEWILEFHWKLIWNFFNFYNMNAYREKLGYMVNFEKVNQQKCQLTKMSTNKTVNLLKSNLQKISTRGFCPFRFWLTSLTCWLFGKLTFWQVDVLVSWLFGGRPFLQISRLCQHCSCPGYFGQYNIKRNDPTCVSSPKVSNASTILSQFHKNANVNTTLLSCRPRSWSKYSKYRYH
jgi:hypothetical protein